MVKYEVYFIRADGVDRRVKVVESKKLAEALVKHIKHTYNVPVFYRIFKEEGDSKWTWKK